MAIYETINPSNTTSTNNIAVKEIPIYGSSRLGQYRPFKAPTEGVNTNKKTALGQRIYEFSNHLGNVLVTLTDNKVPDLENVGQYKAIVLSASDYYPFGMAMKERTYQNSEYRYGFNGKENDTDFGSHIQDYGFRLYSAAEARFLSIDPLTSSYPYYTPYQFAGNTPIQAIDLDGLEPFYTVLKNKLWDWSRKLKVTKNVLGYIVEATVDRLFKNNKSKIKSTMLASDINDYDDWIIASQDNTSGSRSPDFWFKVTVKKFEKSSSIFETFTFFQFWGIAEVKSGQNFTDDNIAQAKVYAEYLTQQTSVEYHAMKPFPPVLFGDEINIQEAGAATMWYIVPRDMDISELKKIANDYNVNLVVSYLITDKDGNKLGISRPEYLVKAKKTSDGINYVDANSLSEIGELNPINLEEEEGKKQAEKHEKFFNPKKK